MKSLFNYITEMLHWSQAFGDKEKANVIVDSTSLRCPIDKIGTKALDIAKDFAENEIKDKCIYILKDWYPKHPSARKVRVGSTIKVFVCLGNDKDRLLSDVLGEIERIGVDPVDIGEFTSWNDSTKTCSSAFYPGVCKGFYTADLDVPTYKQFREDKCIFKVSPYGNYNKSIIFEPNKEGNGYNKLSAETAAIIRRKLYDCIVDSNYQIIEFEPPKEMKDDMGGKYPDALMPQYKMMITPVYNKSKLKSLLGELKSNREWQEFAAEMDRVSKGIRSYYADKRSGDYVGD